MMPSLTDTHCHLASSKFAEDLSAVIARSRAAGVHRMVTIGTDLEDSRKCVEIARQFDGVHAAVGVHPCSVHEVVSDDWLDQLRVLAMEPLVAAIGEAGLDYFHPPPEGWTQEDYHERQKEFLLHQLDLAESLGLNIVIHQRDRGEECWRDLLEIIAPYKGRVRAVFHCFTHGWEEARKVVDDGHLVSFTGVATFKNAKEVQQCATDAAGDCFMVETDAPYLAPEPNRGKRCEPAFTLQTAEKIAGFRDQDLVVLCAEMESTAEGFFRFSP